MGIRRAALLAGVGAAVAITGAGASAATVHVVAETSGQSAVKTAELRSASVPGGLRLYVSPEGNDQNGGKATTKPFRHIQRALDIAKPGTTIYLAAGTYGGSLKTVANGTAASPITIVGAGTGYNTAPRAATVVTGVGRVFEVDNSYVHLYGFTIDGEPNLQSIARPSSAAGAASFKNGIQTRVTPSQLIYVGGARSARGVTGVVIQNMLLRDAGGECVHMHNDATHNSVIDSTIEWCGLVGSPAGGAYAYHNGEGVYLGTSPKSYDQPMAGDDATAFNLVAGNTIMTFGSECVDVKEGSHDNLIVDNRCSQNAEPLSWYGSGLEIRGYDNTVSDNAISGSLGYGLKLASDSASYRQGGNVVTGNVLTGNAGVAIRNTQSASEGEICGNQISSSASTSRSAISALVSAAARCSR